MQVGTELNLLKINALFVLNELDLPLNLKNKKTKKELVDITYLLRTF